MPALVMVNIDRLHIYFSDSLTAKFIALKCPEDQTVDLTSGLGIRQFWDFLPSW